jgi:TolB protein
MGDDLMKMIFRLVLCFAFTAQASRLHAQGSESSPVKVSSSSGPLFISIDNPNFRKLVSAVPTFIPKNDLTNPQYKIYAEAGAFELQRLLSFSGIFQAIDKAAYADMVKSLEQHVTQTASKVLPAPTGLEGINLPQWKTVNVESLTIGALEQASDGLIVELRTIDITRGQLVLAKRYTKVTERDLVPLIRRYANLLLEAYTGKPGIFSSKITFVGRKDKKGSKQIYIADFDGTDIKQITFDNVPHLSPHFSPDGKFLTFTSFKNRNPDLYLYELATGKTKKLSGEPGLNSGGQWAKNSKVIAFTGSRDGDSDIYLVSPSGADRRIFIKGSGLDVDPTFSPDGQSLAFVSGRFGNPHIFVAALQWVSDTNVRVVRDKRLTYAGWYNATPDWSFDSKKIAFAGYDKDIDRFDIFIMNPDGTQLERLTLRRGDNESPSWSPNGQLIMFQSNRLNERDVKGRPQLYIMDRDGANQRLLNTGLYEAQTPAWSGPLYDSALEAAKQ